MTIWGLDVLRRVLRGHRRLTNMMTEIIDLKTKVRFMAPYNTGAFFLFVRCETTNYNKRISVRI